MWYMQASGDTLSVLEIFSDVTEVTKYSHSYEVRYKVITEYLSEEQGSIGCADFRLEYLYGV